MVEGKRTESPMDKVWKFFTSLKLAIFVIIILAVASIIGTIIEQNQPLEKYRQFYSDGMIRLFESLNLFDTYKTAMGSAFARPRVTENSGTLHLYAEKGVVSRFGVYVTHLSIIIIFVGAIIGNVFGFKGFANIVEGQSVRTIPTRGGTSQVALGCAGRCNKFQVDFSPSGQPKEYSSDLSVIEGGREVLRKTIEGNDPPQYKGIWFYQSSYGAAGAANPPVAVN